MPKSIKTTGGSNDSTKSPTAKRFELPVLDFKFGSLTEGTNIPAPLPSPKEEAPPPPKKQVPAPEPVKPTKPVPKEEEETNGHVNGSETSPKPETITIPSYVGVKRPAEEGPASPTGSSRGSLRRLLSKSLLNKTYDEQAPTSGHLQTTSRPPSRTASTMTEERKSKRSSGWFRRLRHHENDNKRVSQQFAPAPPTPKPAGPPPPMIPELSALETKVDTNIGDDIFKGIK